MVRKQENQRIKKNLSICARHWSATQHWEDNGQVRIQSKLFAVNSSSLDLINFPENPWTLEFTEQPTDGISLEKSNTNIVELTCRLELDIRPGRRNVL
jgi:hypothetical protein